MKIGDEVFIKARISSNAILDPIAEHYSDLIVLNVTMHGGKDTRGIDLIVSKSIVLGDIQLYDFREDNK